MPPKDDYDRKCITIKHRLREYKLADVSVYSITKKM